MTDEKERPFFITLANSLTRARLIGGAALSVEIARKKPNFRSWQLFGKLAVVYATDALDGMSARFANSPNPNGARLDERYDKRAYSLIMSALSYATRDPRYALYASAASIRNSYIEKSRIALRDAGLKTDARPLGKAKMLLQTAAVLCDVSPLGETNPKFVHGLHALSVGAGVLSAVDYKQHAQRQLALPLQLTSAQPTHLDAEADFSLRNGPSRT